MSAAADRLQALRRLYGLDGVLGMHPLFTPAEEALMPAPDQPAPDQPGTDEPVPDQPGTDEHNPGGAAALAAGCRCSPLLNAWGAGLRERVGIEPAAIAWFVAPDCARHAVSGEVVADHARAVA